jgi:hypothetical protein
MSRLVVGNMPNCLYPFDAEMVEQGEDWAADGGNDHLSEGGSTEGFRA